MTHNTMSVGIDVGKFEVCVYREDFDQPISLPNTKAGHAELVRQLGKTSGQIIAFEPTGRCEWALWKALEWACFDVRQVSAAHVRHLARSLGNLAKTDPLDARMIARFIAFRLEAGRRLQLEILRKLNVLTTKRCQLMAAKKRLNCQIKQRGSNALDDLDESHMALLLIRLVRLKNALRLC